MCGGLGVAGMTKSLRVAQLLDNVAVVFKFYELPVSGLELVVCTPHACYFNFIDGAAYGAFIAHMEGTDAATHSSSLVGCGCWQRWPSVAAAPTIVSAWIEALPIAACCIALHRLNTCMQLEIRWLAFNPLRGRTLALLTWALPWRLQQWIMRPEVMRQILEQRNAQ